MNQFDAPFLVLTTFSLIWISILTYACWIDLRTFFLPNKLTFALIVLGILINSIVVNSFTSLAGSLLGAMLGYLILWLVNKLYHSLRNQSGIGMGDAKLLAGVGALLGFQAVIPCLLIASISGLLGGFFWLKWKKLDTSHPFPFGPFLGLGAVVLLSLRLFNVTLIFTGQ